MTASPTITVPGACGHLLEIPDFGSLFTLCPAHPQVASGDCDECDELVLSPRMAFFLWAALDSLATHTGEDLDETDFTQEGFADTSTWLELGLLPPIALHARRREWVERFVQCFVDLTERLAHGELPYPRCTGEEMALHMAFNAAADQFADGETYESYHSWYASFPESLELDEDFDTARELLLEDEDVLLLDDISLDGIEDPSSQAAQQLGTVNLHPDTWFLPFAS
jgi:hypothetical protein